MGQPAVLEGPGHRAAALPTSCTNKGLECAQEGPSKYVLVGIPNACGIGIYVGYGGQGLGDLSMLSV